MNKCVLRFDETAWPDDVGWIGWLGEEQGLWAEWASLSPSVGMPMLVGFNAAHQAADIERMNDRDTVASAHKALRAMFASIFPAPRDAQITRWRQDPYSLDSYSFNTVGADREDRLWFAGEAAMAAHFGTAHGALLSGRFVANAILSH